MKTFSVFGGTFARNKKMTKAKTPVRKVKKLCPDKYQLISREGGNVKQFNSF